MALLVQYGILGWASEIMYHWTGDPPGEVPFSGLGVGWWRHTAAFFLGYSKRLDAGLGTEPRKGVLIFACGSLVEMGAPFLEEHTRHRHSTLSGRT